MPLTNSLSRKSGSAVMVMPSSLPLQNATATTSDAPADDRWSSVQAACQKLVCANEPITVVAVRKILGGGSYRDISPLVRRWKELNKRTELPVDSELPERIAEVGIAAITGIWRTAVTEAYVATRALAEGHATAIERIHAEVAEAIQEIERLDLARAEANQNLSLANEQVAFLTTQLSQAAIDLQVLAQKHQEAIDYSDRAMADRAQLQSDLANRCAEAAELRGEIKILREQLASLQRSTKG